MTIGKDLVNTFHSTIHIYSDSRVNFAVMLEFINTLTMQDFK